MIWNTLMYSSRHSHCHVFRTSSEHDNNTLALVSTPIIDSRVPVTTCLYHSEGVSLILRLLVFSQLLLTFSVWVCNTNGPFMPQFLYKSSVMWCRSCQRCLVLMMFFLSFFCAFLAYPCRLLLTVELSASQDHYGFMLFLTEWCVFRVALSPKYTLVYTKKKSI